MSHLSSVHCVMGILLAFPAVAGYIMAVFVMAPLLISVTNAPVFEITPDKYRGATDSCLVELEVNKLHAEGRIELPGIGPVEEQTLFVCHEGKYHAAPHLYAGLWELKLNEAQTAQLAGIFGSFEGQGAPFRYTPSPGGPYDGIPVRMLGRQNGRLIEVADIADSSGPGGCVHARAVRRGGLRPGWGMVLVQSCFAAGISASPADGLLPDYCTRRGAGEHGYRGACRRGAVLGRATGRCGGCPGHCIFPIPFEHEC